MRMSPLLAALTGILVWPAVAASQEQEDYGFDPKEFEKKSYEIGGFLELEPALSSHDQDAALYKLRYPGQDEPKLSGQADLSVRLEGRFEKGVLLAFARTEGLLRYADDGLEGQLDLLEGFVTLKPSSSLAVDVGKKVTKWGTGYFRNAVSFVDRPKDPDDPQEALEGFLVLKADLIRSFDGPVKTVTFTPVVLPVTEDVNREFGDPDHLNFAARLYLLAWDTDVDFLFFTGGSRTTRYGLDFARNLEANLEVHAELAWISDVQRRSVDELNGASLEESDVLSALAGFRYLTQSQITLIGEYYHNGPGIDESEFQSYLRFVDRAHEALLAGTDTESFQEAQSLRGSFAGANPMRDYLYLRASQKEPFGILHLTPGLSSIINLPDGSFQIMPELQYSPSANAAIRLRAAFLVGDEGTEYGEKVSDYRLELRARLFF